MALVVESDPAVAKAFARLLSRRGFDVKIATSAAEAEEIAASSKSHFRLGVFDLALSDESVVSCALRLFKARRVRRCIFLANGADQSEIEAAARFGRVVSKLDIDLFVALVTWGDDWVPRDESSLCWRDNASGQLGIGSAVGIV